MKISELLTGKAQAAVTLPHFPTRWQAVVWRNWGMIPAARLAQLLQTTESFLREAAVAMGLAAEPTIDPAWLKRGYLTIIRDNWHLLDYPQLLELLGWTPERLDLALREEDFLWIKLGQVKPICGKVIAAPLTPAQQEATRFLRDSVARHFNGPICRQTPPFSFFPETPERSVPQPPLPTWARFNLIHAYSASCGDLLSPHGPSPEETFPSAMLERYQRLGIQGIWFHAVLHLLHPVAGAEEFSVGWQERLKRLGELAAHAARHGLKLFLYLNEPRGMSDAFYAKKPEWRGVRCYDGGYANCITRTPEPLQWLEEACAAVFQAVPALGGVLSINMSEYNTHCNCRWHKEQCPTCSQHDGAELIALCLNAIARGVHRSAPQAAVLAMAWSWVESDEESPDEQLPRNTEFCRRILGHLAPGIDVIAISEHRLKPVIAGCHPVVTDYSIAVKGPSPESIAYWKLFQEAHRRAMAKVQINNSWELSAVPWLPIPYVLQENLQELAKCHLDGLMLSWTLGSYPDGNLEMLRDTPEASAARRFAEPARQAVLCQAWKLCSEAFRQYPHDTDVLYLSPINLGPRQLFFPQPTGYAAAMIGFCFDDVEHYRGVFPPETLAAQFAIVAEGFRQARQLLEAFGGPSSPSERQAWAEQRRMITASWAHLQSTVNQIRYTMQRNQGRDAVKPLLLSEIDCTRQLYDCASADPRIGFEASNHYYYTLNDLREKIAECEWLLKN